MSAINGTFHLDGSPVDPEPVRRMVAFLRAQGPHGEAVWHHGPAALGHNLFRATIESERETQPLSLDGQVWISADAFLVGREELVDALRAAGRDASLARPDVELLLHAYHVWGTDCVERLLGYFAFILWDAPRQRVFAARDHFGNRTLYYAQRGPLLVLSNWLDAIPQHPGIPAELSEFHVGSFLALGSVNYLDPSGTAYEGIRKLRPAECLVAERGAVRVRRYWECPVEVPLLKYRREEEVLEQYRALFARAIRDRLRSKRLALTVSGGMDSTSVAAMTASVIRERGYGPELVALTQDHQKINPTREAELASLLCRQYDIPLTLMPMDEVPWLTPDYRPVTLMLYPMANQQQEFVRRLARLAPVGMFGSSGDMQRTGQLSLALRRGNPLTGLTGFFAAWLKHGEPPALNLGIQRVINLLRRHKGHYAPHFPEWLNPELVRRHGFREAFAALALPPLDGHLIRNSRHSRIQYWCARKDNGTVLHGNAPDAPMEGLDPLGDKRLVEFYLTLPPMPWFANKFLQREAMRGLLPEEIRLRPREGVLSHHRSFLGASTNGWLDHWATNVKAAGLFRRDAVPRLVAAGLPSHESLVNLRPWLLNQWLNHRNPVEKKACQAGATDSVSAHDFGRVKGKII
jgi:asparagine synthase (glutamine-hydrolysing)